MRRMVLVGLAAAALSAAARSQAKVCIVGVQHAPGQLLYAGMSPGHVRAALAAFDPEVVCVESEPAWFARGRHYRQTYEASVIALPFARDAKRPVFGIDWLGHDGPTWAERQRRERVAAEHRMLTRDPDPRAYGLGVAFRDQLRHVQGGARYAKLNSKAYAARTVAWIDAKRDEPGAPQEYMKRRDAGIAAHIVAVTKRHPDARILVVIGAMHKGDLERLLPPHGIEIVPAPAIDDRAAEAALQPIDVAAILTHALDNDRGSAPSRERFERLSAKIKDLRGVWFRYVAARLAMIDGQLPRARHQFAALLASREAFPYRGNSWRLYLTVGQAARLELGRIADLSGERAKAIAHYRQLLASLPGPKLDEDYHSDFEFLARSRNAIRTLIARPFVRDRAFAQQPASPAPARATHSLPKNLWTLHRAKRWQALAQALERIDREQASPAQRLELDFHAAAISLGQGDMTRARARILDLAKAAEGLSKKHWLPRSLPALQRRVERR